MQSFAPGIKDWLFTIADHRNNPLLLLHNLDNPEFVVWLHPRENFYFKYQLADKIVQFLILGDIAVNFVKTTPCDHVLDILVV